MRTRKDPEIRREVFIQAATRLFMEKGYDAVSVRSVLAAVDDKSASPSVFYYYFDSKYDLYRACIEIISERYIAGFKKQFSIQYSSLEEWMLSHVQYLKGYLADYLAREGNIMKTGSSPQNRMFILDMREKITQEIASLWADSLMKAGDISPEEARKLSQFLSGGISEMIYNYMLEEDKERRKERADELVDDIIRYTTKAMGFSKAQKKKLEEAM